MEESTGVGGEKEGKGGLLGVGWGKTTKRTSDDENMSVYATRVPVGSQTFVNFSYGKQRCFLVLGEILLSLIRLRTVSS